MTDDSRSDDGLAGLRELIDGVNRFGVDAAAEVVRRFGGSGGPSRSSGRADGQSRLRPGTEATLLQAEVERALDAFLSVTREMYELLGRQSEAGGPADGDVLTLPDATSSGGTSAVLWVHGPAPSNAGSIGDAPANELRLVAGPLLSDRGDVVSGRVVCRPDVVATPAGGDRVAVTVSVDSTGLSVGRYRSTIVTIGDPDGAIGLVVDVVAPR